MALVPEFAPRPVLPAPSYTDASTLLMVVGALGLGLAGLILVGTAFIFSMKMPGTRASVGMNAVSIAALAALGIGLIMKRRTARALAEAGAWIAACSSVISIAVMAASLFGGNAKNVLIVVFGGGTLAVFGVALPILVAVFLGGRNARMTCEYFDPVPRWTDGMSRVSVALTLFALWSGCVSASVTLGPPAPFFGTWFPDAALRSIQAVLAVAWIAAGIGLAKRLEAAWWAALALSVVVGVSNTVTALRVPMETMLRRSGLTQEQIDMSKDFMGNWAALLVAPSVALVALVIAERFCRSRPGAPAGP
jgi:hypothetical protein